MRNSFALFSMRLINNRHPLFYTTNIRRCTSSSASTQLWNSNSNNPSLKFLNSIKGDWAGHLANFDAKNGKLIPVPEHLVPEAMIEWDAAPETLEVLTSDDVQMDNDGGMILERVEVQVMPEVGCGLDNLDTIVKKSCFNMWMNMNDNLSYQSFITCNFDAEDSGSLVMFVPGEPFFTVACVLASDGFSEEDGLSRFRISFNVIPQSCEVLGQISITKERRTSLDPTDGAISKGGGLDARTVTRLIGEAKYSTYESNIQKSCESENKSMTYHLPEDISIQLIPLIKDRDSSSKIIVRGLASNIEASILFDNEYGSLENLSIHHA